MAASKPHPAIHLFAGSICGGVSGIMLQPLDVIKTRLQGANMGHSLAYTEPAKLTGATTRSYSVGIAAPVTARSTVEEIVRIHGIRGMWHGTSATLARTFPGMGTYFFMLSQIKDLIRLVRHRGDTSSALSPLECVLAGASARAASGLLFFPLTLLKTRLESGIWGYQGVQGGLMTMYRTEGFAGMYRGMGATMMRDAPYSGAFFMAYEMNKGFYRDMSGGANPPPAANMLIGAASGMFACGITHPFDVVKTLVQVHPHTYASTLDAARHVLRTRGPQGFYRGFGARLARKSAMACVTWTLYEEIVRACTK